MLNLNSIQLANLSIDSWIRKVNECSVIYEWNEKQTTHFALQNFLG